MAGERRGGAPQQAVYLEIAEGYERLAAHYERREQLERGSKVAVWEGVAELLVFASQSFISFREVEQTLLGLPAFSPCSGEMMCFLTAPRWSQARTVPGFDRSARLG